MKKRFLERLKHSCKHFYWNVSDYFLGKSFAPLVLASNFSVPKRPQYEGIFKDYRFKYLSIQKNMKAFRRPKAVFIWGMRATEGLESYAEEHGIPLYRFEDGFVRSFGLGAHHVPTHSFCMDSRGIYFNAHQPSDLEHLLATYDFQADTSLMQRATVCMERMVQNGVSKYNLPETEKSEEIYGLKVKPRILCIGQVEDDASITFGCDEPITNNELVKLAAAENPEAQIIYKAHPDVIAQKRQMYSNPADIAHLCVVVDESMTMNDALTGVDRVYTITSLAGFEALLRGIPVTCLGMPFYAGWGLTDDRLICTRRERTLTVRDVFAAAYLLYPTYVHPETGEPCTLEEALDRIIHEKRAYETGDLNPISYDDLYREPDEDPIV
jgi:capsular polysaccharide export protein